MNIIRQELKMAFRSWLYFTLALLAILLFFAFFFGALREDASLLDQVLKNFPPEFRAAFGFADVNLGELSGFASFLMNYIVLVGAVWNFALSSRFTWGRY